MKTLSQYASAMGLTAKAGVETVQFTAPLRKGINLIEGYMVMVMGDQDRPAGQYQVSLSSSGKSIVVW
jgi:hypothetical protein